MFGNNKTSEWRIISDVIKGRRSISEFRDTEVPKKIIDDLIEVSSFAPSSTNTQPWFYLVFQSNDSKNRLNSYVNLGYEKLKEQFKNKNIISKTVFLRAIDWFAKYGKFDSAPVYILVFARSYDKKILSQLIKASNNQKIQDIANESTKTSVAMAMQNLLLAAHTRWLWTRVKDWIKFFLDDSDLRSSFYSEFSIPEDFALISGVQLGYPTEEALKRVASERLPLDKIRKYIEN